MEKIGRQVQFTRVSSHCVERVEGDREGERDIKRVRCVVIQALAQWTRIFPYCSGTVSRNKNQARKVYFSSVHCDWFKRTHGCERF